LGDDDLRARGSFATAPDLDREGRIVVGQRFEPGGSRSPGLLSSLGQITLSVTMNASDVAALGFPPEARRHGEHPQTPGTRGQAGPDMIAADHEDAGRSLQEQTLRRDAQAQEPGFPGTVVAAAGRRLDAYFDPPPI
jgi:hypothetical protein